MATGSKVIVAVNDSNGDTVYVSAIVLAVSAWEIEVITDQGDTWLVLPFSVRVCPH